MEGKVILFCMGRSGSSSLMKFCQEQAGKNMLYEPFNKKSGELCGLERQGAESASDYVERCLKNADGLKHVWTQCDVYDNVNLIRSLRKNKVIFLYRKNLLQAAVSHHISEQTGLLETEPEEVLKHEIDPMDIDFWGKWMEKRHIEQHIYQDAMLRNRVDCFYSTYEQLYGESTDYHFGNIMFNITGSAKMKNYPSREKMNNRKTYEKIPNIQEVEQKLGSDEKGWLFGV